jgi:hypothetical protein
MFRFHRIRIARSIAVSAALPIALTCSAGAEPSQYLCTVDQAVGLHYDQQSKVWGPRAFLKNRYILRRLTDDDRDKVKGKWWALLQPHPKADWAFFESGKNAPMPLAVCIKDANGYSIFNCQDIARGASFDEDSRRFELVYHGAYIDQGFWEQFRREHPEQYEWSRSHQQGGDRSIASG